MRARAILSLTIIFFYAAALGAAKYFWLHGGIGPALSVGMNLFVARSLEKAFKHLK